MVVEETGELAGVLSLHRLQRVPRDSRETTTISSLLHRRPPLASPHEPIDDVLERMADHRTTALPIVDPGSGQLLGEVTGRDVFALILGNDH